MANYVKALVTEAKKVSYKLLNLDEKTKNRVLLGMAKALLANKDYILKANQKDLAVARKNKLKESFIDRLRLNSNRIDQMSDSLREIAQLADPINKVIASSKRPSGIKLQKVRVPIGVILVIYEARPNVTSDCIGLLFKSSNVAILRGGKDAINSNRAIGQVLEKAVKDQGLSFMPFFIVEDTNHEVVNQLLSQNEYIDLVIPRGGEQLIRKVVELSKIPVIKHYKGVCHIYVDNEADIAKALKVCVNAKVQRPSVCNAVEKILVHQAIANKFLPLLKQEFDKYGVEIRADNKTKAILNTVKLATKEDWITEYNDLIITIKIVNDLDQAIEHINTYGSHHTDSIISQSQVKASKFVQSIDSACCFINISTRFSDGQQFGLGAEIGISTDKIHARGPMGLEDLTTYKYIASGNGQIRE